MKQPNVTCHFPASQKRRQAFLHRQFPRFPLFSRIWDLPCHCPRLWCPSDHMALGSFSPPVRLGRYLTLHPACPSQEFLNLFPYRAYRTNQHRKMDEREYTALRSFGRKRLSRGVSRQMAEVVGLGPLNWRESRSRYLSNEPRVRCHPNLQLSRIPGSFEALGDDASAAVCGSLPTPTCSRSTCILSQARQE